MPIACSGLCCHEFRRVGEGPFISFSLKLLFAGTGKVSDTTGAGRAATVGDPGLILRFDS